MTQPTPEAIASTSQTLKPLAAVIEQAIQNTPIRLGTDDWGTMLAAQLLADVSAYMGRILGPDARVLAEVQAERERQDAKWGEQNHRDGTGPRTAAIVGMLCHADQAAHYARLACQAAAEEGETTWRLVLAEEVLEALAESDPARLRAELVQVAAVAVAWAAAIDRRPAVSPAAAGGVNGHDA